VFHAKNGKEEEEVLLYVRMAKNSSVKRSVEKGKLRMGILAIVTV
jgi:hypothetical protein